MRQGTVITVHGSGPNLLNGLKRQSSVVMAIIFKEIKVRQRTSKFGMLYVLVEPIIFIVMIATIRYLFRTTMVDGLHVLIWIPLGVTLFLVFRHSVSKVPSAIRSNEGLLDYPQVKPIDPLIAIFILEMTMTLMASSIAMFLIWWFMDLGPTFPQPLEAIGVIVATLAGCFGLALLLGVYGTFYENIPRTIRFLNRPMIFISGVIFSVGVMPNYVREWLSWNPLLQFIEHFRLYAAGQRTFPEADLGYACFVSAFMLGLGFIAYYANRYRLVQSR